MPPVNRSVVHARLSGPGITAPHPTEDGVPDLLSRRRDRFDDILNGPTPTTLHVVSFVQGPAHRPHPGHAVSRRMAHTAQAMQRSKSPSHPIASGQSRTPR